MTDLAAVRRVLDEARQLADSLVEPPTPRDLCIAAEFAGRSLLPALVEAVAEIVWFCENVLSLAPGEQGFKPRPSIPAHEIRTALTRHLSSLAPEVPQ